MWHPGSGTKILLEDPQRRLLCCLRDNNPEIPFPDLWDFPGGGQDPGETLLECGVRELGEEFGLWGVSLRMIEEIPSQVTEGVVLGRAHGRLTSAQVGRIVFGSEGQRFGFYYPTEIASLPFVPQLQEYALAIYGVTNRVQALERSA